MNPNSYERDYFEKIKIMSMRDNVELFAEVLEFIKKHEKKGYTACWKNIGCILAYGLG